MSKTDKFIEVLKSFNKPITIVEWAKRIIELYPAVLIQSNSKTKDKMTLKELVARMSLKVSKGEFSNIEIEFCNNYRKVSYLSEEMKQESIKKHVSKDIEPLMYEEKITKSLNSLSEAETYRVEEFNAIRLQLNKYFNLNFEIFYIRSLERDGEHQADNIQLLTTEHRGEEKKSFTRFSIEEQKAYIKRVIIVHMMVCKKLDISLTDEVLDMLLDRLAKIY